MTDLQRMQETATAAYRVSKIDPDTVTRVYSGRPGCGCGCRGKYYDDVKNIKRVVKAMKANAVGARLVIFDDDGSGAAVQGDRYYWAYFD